MSYHPRSRRDGLWLDVKDGRSSLHDTHQGRTHALSPLGAALWRLADGTRRPAELACLVQDVAPGADAAAVALELDRLADAGCMEGRFAPPVEGGAGLPRRDLLRTLAGASAAGAVLLAHRRAAAAPENHAEQSRKEQIGKMRQNMAVGPGLKQEQLEKLQNQSPEGVVRLTGTAGVVEGSLDLPSLASELEGGAEKISFAFKTSVFNVVGASAKDITTILRGYQKVDELTGSPEVITVDWGVSYENQLQGRVAGLFVGYSLFLEDQTPVRGEYILTLAQV